MKPRGKYLKFERVTQPPIPTLDLSRDDLKSLVAYSPVRRRVEPVWDLSPVQSIECENVDLDMEEPKR